MAWSDSQGHHNVLESLTAALPIARNYAEHIRERVISNEISNNSGAMQQAAVFGLLNDFYCVEEFTRGINRLRINQSSKVSTSPPCEDAQSKVLGMCEAVFNGLTELILSNKPFPFRLDMPKYLNYTGTGLWIFPTKVWCMPPALAAKRHTLRWPLWIYDYNNGRLATLEELRSIKGYASDNENVRKCCLKSAQLQLKAANLNAQCFSRRQFAVLACHVFIIMFVAQTAMNWAQVINLPWTGKYTISAEHQVFRTIKWRADNREIYFEIPLRFLPKFNLYLSLRDYLLDGQTSSLLFFQISPLAHGGTKKITARGFNNTYITLRRIDPSLPKVVARQWRAAKSDWLIRNTDPSTTALVLQNTEKTVLASYAEGSETLHHEEMTQFLDNISTIVLKKGWLPQGCVPSAVGVCSAYGMPQNISNIAPLLPDCKRPEGCLFCDKFKVHADESDTRKLLSCRYCLQQTAPLIGSEEKVKSLLEPILNRIQAILDEISSRDQAIVSRISREVDAGDLDPYWAGKLEMLINLGLVS